MSVEPGERKYHTCRSDTRIEGIMIKSHRSSMTPITTVWTTPTDAALVEDQPPTGLTSPSGLLDGERTFADQPEERGTGVCTSSGASLMIISDESPHTNCPNRFSS